MAKDGYAYNPFITSAMKGLSESVSTALGDIEAGEWSNIAATNGNFGLEDGDYVGLPTADDSWNFKTFTKDEYETLKEQDRFRRARCGQQLRRCYQAHRQRVHQGQLHPVIAIPELLP